MDSIASSETTSVLKALSYLVLSVSFAPFPLSFDPTESAREDALYNRLSLAVDQITASVQRIRDLHATRANNNAELSSFFRLVEQKCATILEVYSMREDFIELVMANGSANMRRLQRIQLEKSPLAGSLEPSSLELDDQESRSALWQEFLTERALPAAELESLGLSSYKVDGEGIADSDAGGTTVQRTTVQMIPPGGVKLLRAWEHEIADAARNIDSSRTAQQIADDPLLTPLFDTASLQQQDFSTDASTRYIIQPNLAPDSVFPDPQHALHGSDDHSLEGYNAILPTWTGEHSERNLHAGREFWRVVKHTQDVVGEEKGSESREVTEEKNGGS